MHKMDLKTKGRIFSTRLGDSKTIFSRLYYVTQETDRLEDVSITIEENAMITGVIEDKI